MGSSRAPPPAPLYTTGAPGVRSMTVASSSPTIYESTPRSAGTESYKSTSVFPSPQGHDKIKARPDRVNSDDSSASADSTVPSAPVRRVSSPAVNVHTHCGRHSDQYLFGGWGPLVKSVFHRKNSD